MTTRDATPHRLNKATLVLLLLLAIGLPLCFGGVRPMAYQSASMLVLVLLALYLTLAPQQLASTFLKGSLSAAVLKALCLIFLYIAAQSIVLYLSSEPHPVLGNASAILRPSELRSSLLLFVFFCSSFILIRTWLGQDESKFSLLTKVAMLVGLLVSLTALSHWFYDNGKLFWTFDPDNIFISNRARWPFVNANHLGHFLLPILFILLAQAASHIDSIRRHGGRAQKQKPQALTQLATSRRLQAKVLNLIWTVSLVIGVLLCILGSLSRSSWIAMTSAAILFSALNWRKIAFRKMTGDFADASERLEVVEVSAHTESRRHRSSRRPAFDYSAFISKALPILFLSCVAVLLVLLLSGRGTELLAERLDYGLMHSKEDLRIQLYNDTWPMIAAHPLLGVGFAGWERSFSRYMDHQLSGLRPVYLHSDPLQALAELGIIGSALIVILFFLLLLRLFKALKVLRGSERTLLTGLLSGSMALVIASFLDFPFRIPAIIFYCAVYLALATYLHDRTVTRSKLAEEIEPRPESAIEDC